MLVSLAFLCWRSLKSAFRILYNPNTGIVTTGQVSMGVELPNTVCEATYFYEGSDQDNAWILKSGQ